MSGTIRQNISCGRNLNDSEIICALELSGFANDLKDLPMGLNTVITGGSLSFSGGQRQRLLISRALIGNPKIIIFDEATSALDNKTQEEIRKNIDSLNVTRIVIAHRLSTIKNADRIYVLDEGRIIDCGTFNELASNKEGMFYQLLKRQICV